MRENDSGKTVVGTGIAIGAGLGVLIGAIFFDAGLNLAMAIIIGTALGLIGAAVLDQRYRRGD